MPLNLYVEDSLPQPARQCVELVAQSFGGPQLTLSVGTPKWLAKAPNEGLSAAYVLLDEPRLASGDADFIARFDSLVFCCSSSLELMRSALYGPKLAKSVFSRLRSAAVVPFFLDAIVAPTVSPAERAVLRAAFFGSRISTGDLVALYVDSGNDQLALSQSLHLYRALSKRRSAKLCILSNSDQVAQLIADNELEDAGIIVSGYKGPDHAAKVACCVDVVLSLSLRTVWPFVEVAALMSGVHVAYMEDHVLPDALTTGLPLDAANSLRVGDSVIRTIDPGTAADSIIKTITETVKPVKGPSRERILTTWQSVFGV